MSLSDIANGTVDVAGATDKKVETAAAKTGGSALGGLMHAGQGVLEALGAPERGAMGVRKSIDDQHLEGGAAFANPAGLGTALHQGAQWFMDPKRQGAASAEARRALSSAPGQDGFLPTDEQINAHLSGFPATAARFGASAASDVIADPTTYVDGAGLVGRAAKALPAVPKALEAVSRLGPKVGDRDLSLSALFNPEHHLGGMTQHGQNVVEGLRNVAKQTAEHAAAGENAAIAAARKDILAGNIPQNVAAILAKYGVTPAKGVKPSQLLHDVADARAAHTADATRTALQNARLVAPPRGTTANLASFHSAAGNAADLFKDTSSAGITKALDGILEHIRPPARGTGIVADADRLSQQFNNQLKGLFLAIPLPHVANLTNLAYNKFGMATTLRGLYYAAREATGHRGAQLDALVDRLGKAGADNQYGKIFSEVNGAPLVGGAIRGAQRVANKAQDVILNPVERGLRASMLQAEEVAGRTGFDAARNIHKALGSDAATGFTQILSHLPLSQFPRFHTQTALGSFGRTLVQHPGRITGFEHVFGGSNRPADGKPHYHLATPTAAGLSMLDNPLKFITSPSTLGGLSGVTNPYGAIGQLLAGRRADDKGQHRAAAKAYQDAAGSLVAPVVPTGPTLAALAALIKKKKGAAGESALLDLASSIGGGYFSKK